MPKYAAHTFGFGFGDDQPYFIQRPHLIERAARWFVTHFPGRVLFAIKANPDPWAMAALRRGGVCAWDVASQAELHMASQHGLNDTLAFMHPIKSPAAIARAYHDFGCRIFAIDHEGELDKLRTVLGPVADLTIIVRIQVSNSGAAMPLTVKFGAEPDEAAHLLALAANYGEQVGICFHVGSQNMRPATFTQAMGLADRIANAAGVEIQILDVGGGFPEHYPGMVPPPWSDYIHAIRAGSDRRGRFTRHATLWCEPGRAIVAPGASVRAQVMLRKDDRIYLNEGGFGTLFDAVWAKWRFPTKGWRNGCALACEDRAGVREYTIYGPTCDSDDVLAHKLALPDTIEAGDEIEFGQLGAYGSVLATRFNGFGTLRHSQADDDPFPNALNTGFDAQPGRRILEML